MNQYWTNFQQSKDGENVQSALLGLKRQLAAMLFAVDVGASSCIAVDSEKTNATANPTSIRGFQAMTVKLGRFERVTQGTFE